MAGSDLFTGSLDLIVLKAVSFGPLHGYAIAHWIRTSTKEGLEVREGALYPALHRLEGKGFLAAELNRWRDYSRIMTLALAASKSGD